MKSADTISSAAAFEDARYLSKTRLAWILAGLASVWVFSFLLAAAVGNVALDWSQVWGGEAGNVQRVIFFETRLPRALLASLVGAGLGLAGAALQGLLRNPLAEPHLIGVSGGAALGAVAAVVATAGRVFASPAFLPLAAAAGALVSVAILYRLALVHGRLHPHVLLLAGVVYNAFAGALIMCVNALADFYQAQGLLSWLMGSVAAYGYRTVLVVFAYTALGAMWLLRFARPLNVLSLGETSARQLGVDVDRVRSAVFLGASLLVGVVVAVSGMIGFVGLIVPHVLRLLFGADYRLLLPASLLGGAIFLLLADTLARTLFAPVELPVGVVTALSGAPFFVFLLRREQKRIYA
jgi:iron complex transport system permease protein